MALVPTGLVVHVPEGYFFGIFARSSTPLKRGLMVANGVGIVDSDYCGPGDEIKVMSRDENAVPVSEITRLYVAKRYGEDDARSVRRALHVAALPESWKGYFRERMARM